MKKLNKQLFALSFVFTFSTAFADPTFTNVSASAQLNYQLEINPMAGGIAWIDYDNDGYQDLYVPNATGHDPYDGDLVNVGPSGPNRLYHNNGDGTFTEVAAQAGVQLADKPSIGVAVGDYNNDGFDDLFVTNAGINTLFENNGNGTFTDVTADMGLDDVAKASFAASFGDIDGDGDLDIYVGHWTDDLASQNPQNRANDLYINNGEAGFTNVASQVGVDSLGAQFTIPMTDFDHDQDLDLFLVNDRFALWLDGGDTADSAINQLFRNDGLDANGLPIFTSYADVAGVDQQLTGMGIAIADVDNDGDLDYYRSQFVAGPLSINDGNGIFTTTYVDDNTAAAVGWGTIFIDVDNDGYVDLYRGNSDSANGKVDSTAYQANNFYMNENGAFNLDTATQAGLLSMDAGLGVAMADYDNDGDQDIVVHGVNGVINLFRNDTVTNNKAISISLNGVQSNKRGIGAKIYVISGRGDTVMETVREVNAGDSHGSNNSFVTHVGIGDIAYANTVTVEWPSGCMQTLRYLPAGFHEITEDCNANHVITGRIAYNGAGLADVMVWDAYDYQNIRSLTDEAGVYMLEGYADTQGAVVVVAGRAGFTFSNSLQYRPSVEGKDVVLLTSEATLKNNTVIGTVRDDDGNGVDNMNVWNVFTYPDQVTTDANGIYVLPDITVGDSVLVNGSRPGIWINNDAGFSFHTHAGVPIVDEDFTIILQSGTVTGTMKTASGIPIGGNDIWDAATFTTPSSTQTSDDNGFYAIPNMTNGNYVVLVPDPTAGFYLTPSIDAFIKEPGPAMGHDFIGVPSN